MMFVMALIMDFGTMAPWKLRASFVAREAVWRTHWPHRGQGNPTPASWPMPAVGNTYPANSPFRDVSLGHQPGKPDAFDTDPFGQHTVVRGPTAVQGSPLLVDQKMLDYAPGMIQGNSHINVKMPLLPNLPRVTFDLQQQMLDGHMQFGPMGYPANVTRRVLLLYGFNAPSQWYRLADKYQQAATENYRIWAKLSPTAGSPSDPGVLTLDRDDEFGRYRNSSPDFHPQIRGIGNGRPQCETDIEMVRQKYLEGPGGLFERIIGPKRQGLYGLPDHMADAFINLYQGEIARLQQLQPPPQGQIAALQSKIDQLNQFRGMLQ